MKLGSHVQAGLISASDEDRKVRPRHPLDRLNVKNGNVKIHKDLYKYKRNRLTESSKPVLPTRVLRLGALRLRRTNW